MIICTKLFNCYMSLEGNYYKPVILKGLTFFLFGEDSFLLTICYIQANTLIEM